MNVRSFCIKVLINVLTGIDRYLQGSFPLAFCGEECTWTYFARASGEYCRFEPRHSLYSWAPGARRQRQESTSFVTTDQALPIQTRSLLPGLVRTSEPCGRKACVLLKAASCISVLSVTQRVYTGTRERRDD